LVSIGVASFDVSTLLANGFSRQVTAQRVVHKLNKLEYPEFDLLHFR